MYVILVYDIKSDEGGQKVLSKTFKTCKKYLSHIQNSVFEGELSNSQIDFRDEAPAILKDYLIY